MAEKVHVMYKSAKLVMGIIAIFVFLDANLLYAKPKPAKRIQQLPAELIGSFEVLRAQNELADQYQLERMYGPDMLRQFIDIGKLVSVPLKTEHFYIVAPEGLSYLLPQAKKFLEDLAAEYNKAFGKRLKITELVRTNLYQQKQIVRRKLSVADCHIKDRCSLHLTGAALDISKKDMSRDEVVWMRKRLVESERTGFIDATEEMKNNNFHIVVFPNYTSLE
ncbi:MAG: hypothetical protein HY456_00900 [Parcubacteria group bacterium]|nr:hypothetical protein [Parcubacteria group bacterium]